MIVREFTISNPSGLHLRPAGVLAEGIGQYASEVCIIFNNKEYNAKSVVNIMTAGIASGSVVALSADGPDETQAMDAAAGLIASGLGE